MPYTVYVEHTDGDILAQQVCCYSLRINQRRAQIVPLRHKDLRSEELYQAKEHGPDLTRFLIPMLQGYQGWAVFCESDMIWDQDVAQLFELCDDRYAVMVVRHDYEKFRTKRNHDKTFPTAEQRHDWSSLILWNCAHPSNRILDSRLVTEDMAQWLHQFGWLKSREIGNLDSRWNWLVGWQDIGPSRSISFAVAKPEVRDMLIERNHFYDSGRQRFQVSDEEWEEINRVTSTKTFKHQYGKPEILDIRALPRNTQDNRPWILHYTLDRPWQQQDQHIDNQGVWERYMKQYRLDDIRFTAIVRARDPNSYIIEQKYADVARKIFQETCDNRSVVDMHQNNDDVSKSDIWNYKRFIKRTQTMLMNTDYPALVIAAAPNSKVVHAKRFQQEKGSIPGPYIIRGIASKQLIEYAVETGQDYYFIETGYFGNYTSEWNPGAKKIFHRLVKNNMQQEYVLDVPPDRWRMLEQVDPRLKWPGWKRDGRNILLVAPSEKPCQFYNIDKEQWIRDTIALIKKHSDRPIITREKMSRGHRTDNSIYDAFDKDVYCVVTYNSIAAVEAVAYGIPAFALAPTAAKPVTRNNLSLIESPYYPDEDFVQRWTHSLAYGQFHVDELANGTALLTMLDHERYGRLAP